MATNNDIVNAVTEQILELQPGNKVQIKIESALQELNNLAILIKGNPVIDKIIADALSEMNDIQTGKRDNTAFGNVLGDLDTVLNLITNSQSIENIQILTNVISQIENMLNYRPDIESVLSDLDAVKKLRGGPADEVAFHDYNVLQIAFKSVWKHAFNQNIPYLVEQLYLSQTQLYNDALLGQPDFESLDDVASIEKFINDLQGTTIPTVPIPPVLYGQNVEKVWNQLSPSQISYIITLANQLMLVSGTNPSQPIVQWTAKNEDILNKIDLVAKNPNGNAGRISQLISELSKALTEPYSFDVFAKYTYNFGLMITYRQIWEPGEYQAGDLISTIPLAPGEVRKYSKKVNIKRTRSEKEIEKSISSSSYQSSETARAESDIMKKTTTATNFKMASNGSFDIGIGSINTSTEFTANQGQESISNKKEFHEATLKAAQEYRLERSMEVDTTTSIETEETNSGEISNPNNEITVTYLFYELQRRYKISEFLYRVRPVIMVALDMPSPHQIDEAWLIQYQWIISRSLLDDSFRNALNYLTSGMAGDEVSIDVIKAHWELQKNLVNDLEGQVQAQISMRDSLRESLVQTALQKSQAEASEMPTIAKVFTLGLAPDPGAMDADMLEAGRHAAETRLGYVEQALADAQDKLKQANDSFQQATKEYAAALQNQFARHVAIDQLRIHVKQNIIYYMQAIWSHKVADQSFFELYKLPVACPDPVDKQTNFLSIGAFAGRFLVQSDYPAPSTNWDTHELIEMADIDNPLGFKANYIIFPMKEHCYLTDYMLTQFIDEFTNGLKDPDSIANFLESFDRLWGNTYKNPDGTKNPQGTGVVQFEGESYNQAALKSKLEEYVVTARRSKDEIIVPTGQLFIEALPGSHPLLEDFKLLHRIEDVRKVKAEVRHAELENLRLAARLFENQNDNAKDNLLEDPDIEKKIIVEGNADVNIHTN